MRLTRVTWVLLALFVSASGIAALYAFEWRSSPSICPEGTDAYRQTLSSREYDSSETDDPYEHPEDASIESVIDLYLNEKFIQGTPLERTRMADCMTGNHWLKLDKVTIERVDRESRNITFTQTSRYGFYNGKRYPISFEFHCTVEKGFPLPNVDPDVVSLQLQGMEPVFHTMIGFWPALNLPGKKFELRKCRIVN